MPAARKHTTLVVVSVSLLAALALAGAAGGVRVAVKKDREAPSAPTNVRVTSATPTSVSLAWDPSTDDVGVSGYYVYVDAVRDRVSGTHYTATNLACGESIGVWVVAFDRRMNRTVSPATTVSTAACPDTQAPTPPSGFRQAATTQGEVVLEWDDSSDDVGVVGYGIYRNQLPVEPTSGPTVTLTGLVCGSTFEYQVDAVDAAGNRSQRRSAWVQTARCTELPPLPPPTPPPSPSPPPPDYSLPADQTPPSEPANLLVAGATRTSVSLTWNPSSDNVGVLGYRVYVDGATVLNPTQPGATVTALACGTAFTFEVDAVDAAGNRSARARVTVSTSACADAQTPTAPTNIIASSRTATSIALTWSASSDNVGVTSYGLYRGGTLAGTSSTTTGIFSGLSCNTNYTLAVDAADAAGNRSLKATVMVATTACPDTTAPSPPTGLAASNVGQTSLTLTWNASTDNVAVTAYDVYKNDAKMASVTSRSSNQSELTCGTSYWFGVEALDAAGNKSGRVNVNATTSACPPPTAPPPPPAPPPSPAPAPSGPITITAGGTYTGNWVSTDSTPAVRIATTAPVTIVNSTVANLGSGELVRADSGANVTITQSTLNGGNGRAFYAAGIKSLTIRNCSINKTSGIRFDGAAASASITVTRNKVRNIQSAGYNTVFTQLANVTTATIDISWNEVINVFGQSGVEDNINLYKSAFAKVHDNYIQGAYPASAGSGFSGSGIMVDEVGSHDNEIYSNQVVDTTNAGIGVSGGWNNSVHDNRVVFDGKLDDGTPLAGANVGVAVWNLYSDPGWASNAAFGNTAGWVNASGARADWWLPGCAPNCTNVPFSGTLNHASEVAEYQIWVSKLAANGVSVGA